jgi:hypothetical protein
MTREELEHIIRASGDVTGQYEFIIVGSQSILGSVPNPAAVFTMSAEADIYPLQAPELAEKTDGALGEGSQFHETYGYYAQGVGPETAALPAGWMDRVHRVQNAATNDRVGLLPGRRRPLPVQGRGGARQGPRVLHGVAAAWPCEADAGVEPGGRHAAGRRPCARPATRSTMRESV